MGIDARKLHGLKLRPPAESETILRAERQLGIRFPPDYSEFLRIANGGEGFIGGRAYVSFWAADDLVRLNNSYKVQDFAPGLVIIGTDGADEAYGIDSRAPGGALVQIPFIPMDWRNAARISESFAGFLDWLCTYRPADQ